MNEGGTDKAKKLKVKTYFLDLCQKKGIDYQTIDFEAHYDSTLNVVENKRVFKEKIGELVTDLKELALKHHAEQERAQRHAEKVLIEEINTAEPTATNITSFEIPKHLILMTAKKISNSTFIVGEGGIGKTFLTINSVKELGLKYETDYIYINSFTTPLSLYQTLHDNRDKLIILDDIEGVLGDKKALAILRSALWESVPNKRIVTYLSTTKVMEEYQPQFEFTGQIILLANKVENKNDVHAQAFVSRTNFYELKFTFAEKKAIFKKVSEKPYKDLSQKDREFVLNKLLERVSLATRELNLRTLVRSYDFFIYNPEKLDLLLDETLRVDDELALVVRMMNDGLPVRDQLREWTETTGKSRISYFRKKRGLKHELKNK